VPNSRWGPVAGCTVGSWVCPSSRPLTSPSSHSSPLTKHTLTGSSWVVPPAKDTNQTILVHLHWMTNPGEEPNIVFNLDNRVSSQIGCSVLQLWIFLESDVPTESGHDLGHILCILHNFTVAISAKINHVPLTSAVHDNGSQ